MCRRVDVGLNAHEDWHARSADLTLFHWSVLVIYVHSRRRKNKETVERSIGFRLDGMIIQNTKSGSTFTCVKKTVEEPITREIDFS